MASAQVAHRQAKPNAMPHSADSLPNSGHLPSTEEDESHNETGSESIEPITPTDIQFHHPFQHHEATVDTHANDEDAAPEDKNAGPVPQQVERPAPTLRSTATSMNSQTSETAKTPTVPKGMESFFDSMRKANVPRSGSVMAREALMKPVNVPINTDVPRTKITPPSATADKSMSRRLSNWSIKNNMRSPTSNSPPSPGSPVDKRSEDSHRKLEAAPQLPSKRQLLKHRHTNSDNLSKKKEEGEKSNKGITWAFGKDKSKAKPVRRRSASQEIVPTKFSTDSDDHHVGLLETVSRHAAEGAGMKARRLSTSLPDEYNVDSCELMKEFKCTSMMPGKRGRKLGVGATAVVSIMCKKNHHDDLVAVKEYRKTLPGESDHDYLNKIKSEFCIAKSLHHPNIVETVRLCSHKKQWNHVMEYCLYGEMYVLVDRGLFRGEQAFYRTEDRHCFWKQLLRAVDYLHAHGIAHRDIKLENILMDKNGQLKLSDFGVSEVFCGEHPGMRTSGGECGKNMREVRMSQPGPLGSVPYVSPEVAAEKDPFDPRLLDVWACGIVYLSMTFGGLPWGSATPGDKHYAKYASAYEEWLKTHPDGQFADGPDGMPKAGPLFAKIEPPALKRLLLRMIQPRVDLRITMRQVMETNFVKGIECCTPESFEEVRGTLDASRKESVKQASKMVLKKHHHIPPKEVGKFHSNLTHKFDMGHQ